jgi:uncharacterized protein
MLIARYELEIHRLVVERVFNPGALDFHSAEFRQIDPLTVKAVAELLGDEILIRGSLRTRIESTCDRCLNPVQLALERDFDLTYRPMSTIAREEEIELPEGELDIGFYEGEGIELGEVLAEQVNLAVPMKVVCREDCRGLCPTCGADRNNGTCACPPPPSASPFATLWEK